LEDVMKIVTGETGWQPADCVDLGEYKEHRRSHWNTVMKLWAPQHEANLNEPCSITFSKRYA